MGRNERAKIVMSDDEIAEFIDHSRTATLGDGVTGGRPHLVAMWYAVLDGEIWFETKAKSQKAVNLRRSDGHRDDRGREDVVDTLAGVSIDGSAEIVDDPDRFCAWGLASGSATPARTATTCGRTSIR